MHDKTNNNQHITFFFRNKKAGFSMHRVFSPIVQALGPKRAIGISAPDYRALPWSILRNLWWAFKNRNRKGINHITGDLHYLALALPARNTVLTIHDLVTLRLGGNPIKKYLWRKLWFDWPLRRVGRITCISETTKAELLSAFPWLNPSKVFTVHNPIDPLFTPAPKVFDEHCPTILHIGTGWNKNLERVTLALKGISCKLLIVGALSDAAKQLLEENGVRYDNRVNISDDELLDCYRQCHLVSFPSIFEGFGMPIIEAQATGCAVITSNINPMKEIAADGACLVNPLSVESLNEAFRKLVEDEAYRDSLVKKGFVNAERFSLGHIVSQYLQVYNTCK